MDSKNDGQQPVVNNIYGFQFNGCQITNPTFQTVMPSSTGAEKTEADEERNVSREHDVDRENGVSRGHNVSRKQDVVPEQEAALLADDPLPEPLRTAEAQEVLKSLCSGNFLDVYWQPVGLSNTKKGVLASLLADRLHIGNLWQTFGNLWHIKPETLRSAYNKGMDQKGTGAFMERVKRVL